MTKISPAVKAAEKEAILITGASSGMELAAAKELASQDHSVYGAVRCVEKMAPLAEYNMHTIELDATGEEACKDAVGWVVAERGRINVLVNNAGYGFYGTIEDVGIGKAHRQFDVNVFGLAALTKVILLHMHEGRSGTIVNVSSMGKRFVSFMGGWHHVTKYVVEALSNTLRMEAAEFDINVVLIEPDGIKTEWADIAADHFAGSSKGGAYKQTTVKAAEGMRRQYSGRTASDPGVVVRAISRTVNARQSRLHHLVGFGAKPLVVAHTMLPMRVFDWVTKRAIFAPNRRRPRRSQQRRPR